TPVCDTEAQRFNNDIAKLGDGVAVLVASMDLPFAQKRWCGAQSAENISLGSDYKNRSFGEDFGVVWQGPMLLARAVFVADADGTIQHIEYVSDIASEPDYEAVKAKVSELLN
ncbi:MAG: redoxin domain-containing protein, partial [Bdellovibrionales bacterium]|nr:redoxin domain-containing protein [Bdellovibrionales bacterium]